MPRIKRWFPVSHGFNRDPEVQELRREYADWMGYVWQEMCAIGDLNDGVVKGTHEQIGMSLAYISLIKRPSLSAKCITNALRFMEKCGWIQTQTDCVLIVKHLKYHRTENQNPVPPDLTRPNQTGTKPNKNKIAPAGFDLFYSEYPKKVARGAAEKAWLAIKPDAELQATIFAAVKNQIEWRRLRAGNPKLFTPEWKNPATWLNQKCWLDEIEPIAPAEEDYEQRIRRIMSEREARQKKAEEDNEARIRRIVTAQEAKDN